MKRLFLVCLLTLAMLTSGCSPFLTNYLFSSGDSSDEISDIVSNIPSTNTEDTTSTAGNSGGSSVSSGSSSATVKASGKKSYSGYSVSSQSTSSNVSSATVTETPQNAVKDYYYTQLNDTQKVIYEKISYAMNSLSSTAAINGNPSEDDITLAYYAYRWDNPQVFYLPNEYQYSSMTSKKNTTYKIQFTYKYTSDEISSLNSRLEAYVSDALSKINSSMSDFDKEVILHDYIVDSAVYSSDTSGDENYTVIGILSGSAVCEGYAKMMKLLYDRAGISTIVVSGTGESGGSSVAHAWNIALVGGQYYHVDATFDDTTMGNLGQTVVVANVNNSSQTQSIHSYQYFNLNDTMNAKTHTVSAPDPKYNDIWFKVPQCTSTTMNYYRQTGSYLASTADASAFFDTKLTQIKNTGYYYFYIQSDSLSYDDFTRELSNGCRRNNIRMKSYQLYGYTNESLFSDGCIVVLK